MIFKITVFIAIVFTCCKHETLHLSQGGCQIVLDFFDKIHNELLQGLDKHSKNLVVSNIGPFLDYCTRFYDRQFIIWDNVNLWDIENFESALNVHMKLGKAKELGTPLVSYFSEEQHFSPNYFGNLVKKETGRSAYEIIQAKIIEVAKEKKSSIPTNR
tara:strand:+ start:636 stop:1109 length:474 start_codon:yes stop_codon:yes gene_type:complete